MGVEVIDLRYPLMCPAEREHRVAKEIVEGNYYGEHTRQILPVGDSDIRPQSLPEDTLYRYNVRVLESGDAFITYFMLKDNRASNITRYNIPEDSTMFVLREVLDPEAEKPRVRIHTIVSFV